MHGCEYKTKQHELQYRHAANPTYSSTNFMNAFTLYLYVEKIVRLERLWLHLHAYTNGVNDFKKKAISSVKLFIIYGALLW